MKKQRKTIKQLMKEQILIEAILSFELTKTCLVDYYKAIEAQKYILN